MSVKTNNNNSVVTKQNKQIINYPVISFQNDCSR